MNLYLVLGATNSVISHAEVFREVSLVAEAIKNFVGCDSGPAEGGAIVSSVIDKVTRRAMYLPLAVDPAKYKNEVYVLVSSVPYLHSTTRARVFYDEAEAKAEVKSFNSAVSRASFHAYLFTYRLYPEQ
ncbi:hypothetical protein [Sporomusa aerivorans]|uniref:hypothetical protein n=1 Tax=Sporomusa aerivorans TaxID=204936 RepID=UPI00352B13F0